MIAPSKYFLKDDGFFPNSSLPVLHYRELVKIPWLLPAKKIKALFHHHGWGNTWRGGIFTFRHYHSNTHEAMVVIKGKTVLELGGPRGMHLTITKGDLLLIPAGVAHKNEGHEKDVICVGGYPGGIEFDIELGLDAERPKADQNIAAVPIPLNGPISDETALHIIWSRYEMLQEQNRSR